MSNWVKLWIKRWEVSWRWHFAHHPLCDRYSDQTWNIGSFIICQGCSLVLTGIISGFSLCLLLGVVLDPIGWIILWAIFFLSTILGEFYFMFRRPFKRMARFFAGIGIGSFFWFLLTEPNIIYKLIGAGFGFIAYSAFLKVRGYTKVDKCYGCPELKPGICPGLEHESLAMKEYSNYATTLLEDQLREKFLARDHNLSK
ncbi:MAG: hypothetical protein JSV04_01355 [Candidatus Heimdallarchaeota archaeon]|nr:MAG: hypothetical protein JSV04_01355 [Candidatus Heimdallarchaeota archaeon]